MSDNQTHRLNTVISKTAYGILQEIAHWHGVSLGAGLSAVIQCAIKEDGKFRPKREAQRLLREYKF